MQGLELAEILKKEMVTKDVLLLKLKVDDHYKDAEPGQFVMLQSGEQGHSDPYLRRAISICDIKDGCLSLLIQVVGKGTEWLTKRTEGDFLSVLGPLGKGFDTSLRRKKALIVAGGIGMAPFAYLTRLLHEQQNQVIAVVGGRNAEALVPAKRVFLGLDQLVFVSEDGSLGKKGLVTHFLPDLATVDAIYACGPNPMLQALKSIAEASACPCQLSLEGKMACGVGVCLGCTCKKGSEEGYAKVCTNGPVFWSTEVDLG